MKAIKQILILRDNMSPQAADDLIQEAKNKLQEYLENNELHYAEDICAEFFGPEQDYIDELL